MLNLTEISFNKRLGNLIGRFFEMPYVSYCHPLRTIIGGDIMARNIFISYSVADSEKMNLLKGLIEDSKILGKPIVVAETDDNMKQLTEKIIAGLNHADYFIPILTTVSIETQWVNQEIGFAKCKEIDGLLIIKPIVERSLLKDIELKGFINKQLDLPYNFDGDFEDFKKIASKLIEKIKSEYVQREKLIQFSGDSRRFKKIGTLLYQFPNKQTRELFGYLENDLIVIDEKESSNYKIAGIIPSIKTVSKVKFSGRYYALFENELKLIPDDSTLDYINRMNKKPIKEIEELPDDYKTDEPLISYEKIKTNK